MEPVIISLFGGETTLYGILAVITVLLTCAAAEVSIARRGLLRGFGLKASVFGALVGFIFGRGLYCALQAERLFYDPMGEFMGLGPFFDLGRGSVNVIGVLAGCFLALWIASKAGGVSLGKVLDAAALPGLCCFAVFRFIEPFSGQGYGPMLRSRFFSRVPFGIPGWDFWSLSVCFIEGVLLAVLALILWRAHFKRAGSLFLLAAVWTAVSQIIPESLREDDTLRIFVFARVDQIGSVLIWLLCGICLWFTGLKRGISRGVVIREAAINLLGVMILIAAEFTLDKTEWSEYLIYGVMTATLIVIGLTLTGAVLREDRAVSR